MIMMAVHHRVNYDLIAHLYDEPSRDYGADQNLVKFLKERRNGSSFHIRILDTGCGTGKQLTANRIQFPEVEMTGLDLFHGMLDQARKRCSNIQWIQGDSTNPPFANNSFNYITNQFSYHHVQDKSRMIMSIFRMLKPKGRFVITNLDPWSMPGWIVYQFFPPSRQRDLSDFLHYASQRYRTPQLMAIKDNDYEACMTKLRAHVAELSFDAHVSSEICLVWVIGDKPG